MTLLTEHAIILSCQLVKQYMLSVHVQLLMKRSFEEACLVLRNSIRSTCLFVYCITGIQITFGVDSSQAEACVLQVAVVQICVGVSLACWIPLNMWLCRAWMKAERKAREAQVLAGEANLWPHSQHSGPRQTNLERKKTVDENMWAEEQEVLSLITRGNDVALLTFLSSLNPHVSCCLFVNFAR